MKSPPVIALISDCGTRDWYIGAVKGVLLTRCPTARLIDITHEIAPFDIAGGAFMLTAAARWFPLGAVSVAVVDPGVGTPRALVAVEADGRYFVGPDNGVLALVLEQAKSWRAVRLATPRYWLAQVSQTFQGRDIMAPVAAYLAGGGALQALGPRVRALAPLVHGRPRRVSGRAQGCVVHIDGYGNLISNVPAAWLASGSAQAATRVRYRDRTARVVSSYGYARAGELVAVAGSSGCVELAVREGSAAVLCRAARGDVVELILPRRPAASGRLRPRA